jgi:hypothetical protein
MDLEQPAEVTAVVVMVFCTMEPVAGADLPSAEQVKTL